MPLSWCMTWGWLRVTQLGKEMAGRSWELELHEGGGTGYCTPRSPVNFWSKAWNPRNFLTEVNTTNRKRGCWTVLTTTCSQSVCAAFAGPMPAPLISAAGASGLAARSQLTFPLLLTLLSTGCGLEQGAPWSLAEQRTRNMNQQKGGGNTALENCWWTVFLLTSNSPLRH